MSNAPQECFFKKTNSTIFVKRFVCQKQYLSDVFSQYVIVEISGECSVNDFSSISEIPREYFVIGTYDSNEEAIKELKEFKASLKEDGFAIINEKPLQQKESVYLTQAGINWNLQRLLVFSFLLEKGECTKQQVVDYLNKELERYGKVLNKNAKNTVGAFLTLNGKKHSKGTGFLDSKNQKWSLTAEGRVAYQLLKEYSFQSDKQLVNEVAELSKCLKAIKR